MKCPQCGATARRLRFSVHRQANPALAVMRLGDVQHVLVSVRDGSVSSYDAGIVRHLCRLAQRQNVLFRARKTPVACQLRTVFFDNVHGCSATVAFDLLYDKSVPKPTVLINVFPEEFSGSLLHFEMTSKPCDMGADRFFRVADYHYPLSEHDGIQFALAKERSRIACVIRRVSERWKDQGALEIGRMLVDVANAVEQETA